MKPIYFFISAVFVFSSNSSAQSLATNLLFEQAHVVYKGKVESIGSGFGDAEGENYIIRTSVEEVYKGLFYDEEIRIRTKKPYELDPGTGEFLKSTKFQLKEDSLYVFFVIHLSRTKEPSGKYQNYADFTEVMIEGIPFHSLLEDELGSIH